ncbi:MAG: AF1514 family protein [Dehalococcoidia bacterium]
MKTVKLESNADLAFDQARKLADAEAGKHLKEPMNLSWLDRIQDRHFPNVECCQEDGKESWEIYAESRGGEVRVEVGESYVFIFREGAINH